MTWYQQTIVRCVMLVARLIATVAGEAEIAAELKTLANHIAVGAPKPDLLSVERKEQR